MTTQKEQSSLDHISVGDIRGNFFVPHYQRGYRWGTYDVECLLNDIWENRSKGYNLQPVVVKRHKKDNDDQNHEWELIDGQQRLTTLFLIFLYMHNQGWKKMGAPYSLRYETRPGSEIYLSELGSKKLSNNTDHTKNIDYFHLYTAYECIGQWFQKHGDEHAQENIAGKFHGSLSDPDNPEQTVRVIWYEAPDSEDSNALFTRLNVGRIPLTDAELVKASLLSGVRDSKSDRAQELAAQWDGIERDLHNPDVWAFVAGVKVGDDSDKYPTRISLLLDTLAPLSDKHPPRWKRPRHYTFETLRQEINDDPDKFWGKVLGLHSLILGWFDNPHIYNKIGFLVTTGSSFSGLVKLSEKLKKSEFDKKLIVCIRKEINICESSLLDLSYDKKSDHSKILNLLLLMNVETISRTEQRFPFRRHVGKKWSLEHIHAQNSENLNTVKQWKSWLEVHRDALCAMSGHQSLVQEIGVALQGIDTDHNFGQTFKRLASRVTDVFSAPESGVTNSDHGLHTISNLALLSSGDNSALSNAVFEVKRQKILEVDRNENNNKDCYIPICTRNVFLKYYAGANAQQVHFWGPQDRQSYYKAIVSILNINKDNANAYLEAEEIVK